MRILIADDDATLRTELAGLLRGDGHDVEVVADGEEAHRVLLENYFDVALLDLVMPRATGLDILHRLRARDASTAVVMITGHGSVDVAVEAMKAGAVDFLVKPFEVSSLEKILQAIADEALARRMLERPAVAAESQRELLEDAARRKVLMALLGPRADPPRGATRTLRIDDHPRPPDVFSPPQLYRVNTAVDEFLSRADRPVIYAADVDVMGRVHGRDDFKAWIRHLGDRCATRGGVLLVATADSALATELDASQAGAAMEPTLQGMLESLANPIRRAIVAYVYASGASSYSAILRMDFVDSSSKLSFHLQRLLGDGLLRKDEKGAYALTDDGRRAWRVVRALSDERKRPSILFVSP